MLDGHRRIEELADGPEHIIPGHDPAVLARFPPVRGADGIVALHRHPLDTYAGASRHGRRPARFRWRMDLGANSDESNSRGDRGHGRGLTVLERILEHAHSLPEARLDIEVFGTGRLRSGRPSRRPVRPSAHQYRGFAGDDVRPGQRRGWREGLSLVQWAHLSGYRRHGDRYLRTFEDSGRAITDADHLPRSLLGEYLSWVYRRVVGLLPAHVGVYHHKTRVVDIARHDGGFELALENGARRQPTMSF